MELMARRGDKVFNKFTTATQGSSRAADTLFPIYCKIPLSLLLSYRAAHNGYKRGTPSNIEHHRGPAVRVPTNVLQPVIAWELSKRKAQWEESNFTQFGSAARWAWERSENCFSTLLAGVARKKKIETPSQNIPVPPDFILRWI